LICWLCKHEWGWHIHDQTQETYTLTFYCTRCGKVEQTFLIPWPTNFTIPPIDYKGD